MSRSTCIADRRQKRERLRSIDERETSLKRGRRRNTKKSVGDNQEFSSLTWLGLLFFSSSFCIWGSRHRSQNSCTRRRGNLTSIQLITAAGSPSKWRRMILAYGRRCKCTASKPTLDVTPPTRHEGNKK